MQESHKENRKSKCHSKHMMLVSMATLYCGLPLGMVVHKAWIFLFRQLSSIKQGLLQRTTRQELQRGGSALSTQRLQIPVRYLPKYRIEIDERGKKRVITEEGHTVLDVSTEEVALVLVDTWANYDQTEEPSTTRLNQKRILDECRKYGITIIHAPNDPVINKYHQYHRLKAEVSNFVSQFDLAPKNPPPFLKWPVPSNHTWQKAQTIRKDGRAPAYQVQPITDRDISRHLTPLQDEYVLCSHIEFRYVLWKERINVLLYIGDSLNECMQQRDTGINALAGIDSSRVPITIVVLEDCSSAMGDPDIDSNTAAKVILNYFKYKIAFVANSADLCFTG